MATKSVNNVYSLTFIQRSMIQIVVYGEKRPPASAPAPMAATNYQSNKESTSKRLHAPPLYMLYGVYILLVVASTYLGTGLTISITWKAAWAVRERLMKRREKKKRRTFPLADLLRQLFNLDDVAHEAFALRVVRQVVFCVADDLVAAG